MNKFVYIFAGAAGGFAAGFFTAKRYYKKLHDADLDETRSAYNQRLAEMSKKNRNKPSPEELLKALQEKEPAPKVLYDPDDVPEDAVISVVGPVLQEIGQDDFIMNSAYDKVNIVVYKDGIAATEADDDVIDIDETIGIDAVNRVLSGADEAVYIRNENRMTEYEVTASDMTYTEATGIIYRG